MLNDLFKKKKKYTTVNTQNNTNKKQDEEIKKLIEKCKGCKSIVFKKDLDKNLYVCPNCKHHFAISSHARLDSLFDNGEFIEYDKDMTSKNPLSFPNYEEKMESDKAKSGLSEAVVTGIGKMNGIKTVIGVMDSRFRMGSMGSVVGEKITRAIENAIKEKTPFILFCASGGARMQEGVLSLMQMAKTSSALEKLSKEELPYISVLTNPTTGGVSASFATLGDLNIAEPGALIGFAGRRIIEQTIREKLPEDFQTAEFLLEHGHLDLIVSRIDMKQKLTSILTMHGFKGENENE